MVHNHKLITGLSTRILLVIERNYANGQLATFMRKYIDEKLKQDRRQVEKHHGINFIDVYTEPEHKRHTANRSDDKQQQTKARDEQMATGFLTTNPTKGYGVFRLRQRLECGRTHLAFPVEPIITTTQGQNDASIRHDTLEEFSRFEGHSPSEQMHRKKLTWHGKRKGKTDDKPICFFIADTVYCQNCNEAEEDFRDELSIYQ